MNNYLPTAASENTLIRHTIIKVRGVSIFILELKTYHSSTAKSDEIAHPMDLRTQYHKTVLCFSKRSVTLLRTHGENILPYTVKIDSARALTTFSRNFRFFAIRKTPKNPEWNFSSIHGMSMSKIVYQLLMQ